MFLKQLEIKEMFGIFNYLLEFNEDMTIITAPNGYGKTICLKIIHSIFNLNFMYFAELEFSEIKITTEIGILTIRKSIPTEDENNNQQVDLFEEDEEKDEDIIFVQSFNIFVNESENDMDDTKILITLEHEFEPPKLYTINIGEQYELYRRNLDEFYPFLRIVEPL